MLGDQRREATHLRLQRHQVGFVPGRRLAGLARLLVLRLLRVRVGLGLGLGL